MEFIERYILVAVLLLAFAFIVRKFWSSWRRLSDAKNDSSCGYHCEDCPFGQASSAACHERALSPDQQLALLSQATELSTSEPSSETATVEDDGHDDAELDASSEALATPSSVSGLSKTVLGQLIEEKTRRMS